MTLITPVTGPRNARTDPDSGLRMYRWQDKEYPSVTTIRRMAGLPFGLHSWMVGKVVDRAVAETDTLVALADDRTPTAIKTARTWLRAAATEERDRAANLGTRVHDAAASAKTAAEVPEDIAPFVRQYRAWLDDSGAEILLSERQAWNLTLGYAGTFDALVRFPSGRTFVVDYKTGKGTYTEHALQLVAYAMAEFVGEDDVVDEPASGLLADADGVALLHLRPDGWTWQQVRVTPRLYRAFTGLLDFALFAHAHPSIDGLITATKTGSDDLVARTSASA